MTLFGRDEWRVWVLEWRKWRNIEERGAGKHEKEIEGTGSNRGGLGEHNVRTERMNGRTRTLEGRKWGASETEGERERVTERGGGRSTG